MRRFRLLNHLRARTGFRGRVRGFHGNWIRSAHAKRLKPGIFRRARRGRR